jgi:hypothetical protein
MASNTESIFSPPNTTLNSLLKLDGGNYTSWVTQIHPILRTYDLMGIIDGVETCPPKMTTDDKGNEIPNPEYLTWNKKDQYLLCLITASLSEKVLSTVYGLNTSHQAWTALSTKFASKSKSRISNLKKQLQGLSQGSKSCSYFMQAAKHIADQLGATGNPISDEELISSILNGLNPNFTHFITTYSFHTRANDISYEDFQDELITHEMLLNQHQQHTADQSTFALTANRPFPQSRGQPPMQNRFSPRPYSPRQGFGYSTPRPYHQQFNRGRN